MSDLFNNIIKTYLRLRYRRIDRFKSFPILAQLDVLDDILNHCRNTEFGNTWKFDSIRSYNEFKQRMPLFEYNDIAPFVKRMMMGERNVLAPGKIQWFAKSSGTSSDKSKFIPVTKRYLYNGHIKSSWDSATLLYHQDPNLKIFAEKNLIMGGTVQSYDAHPSTMYGDISGIIIHNMPSVGRPFYTPDFETALLANWDEKIDRMVKQASEQDVVMFGGVPTWVIVLFEALLDHTGKSSITDIWPNVNTYVHGGVSMEPYKNQIRRYIPKEDFRLVEAYNASEGYFALQDDSKDEGMLLLLDNSVFYEFIPLEALDDAGQNAVMIDGVEEGKTYALVISNPSGLVRYLIGDTIQFTSLDPFRIKVVGRTQHYINVFGEEVMVTNTDQALAMACHKFGVEVRDYTVAPIFLTAPGKGGHEWAIEFVSPPDDILAFETYLDQSMQEVNSDYEAKRYKGMALDKLKINIVPKDGFNDWLRQKGKIGGQSKIPRLSNKRDFLEQIVSSPKGLRHDG